MKHQKMGIAFTPIKANYRNQSVQILEDTPTPISLSQSFEDLKEAKAKVSLFK